MKRIGTMTALTFLALLLTALPASATHIPVAIDSPLPWTPLPGSGYLNFTEAGPGVVPPCPGPAPFLFGCTEDHTGWSNTAPAGAVSDNQVAPVPTINDFGLTHGDRGDHDWVVENRRCETGGPCVGGVGVLVNHFPATFFMQWEIGVTTPSAHTHPTFGAHVHAGQTIPVCPDGSTNVCLPDYAGATFDGVDVFSVADLTMAGVDASDFEVTDVDISIREAALDYGLDPGAVVFCSAITGACAPGAPFVAFIPGWDPTSTTDDFVLRIAAPFPSTHVIIDPSFPLGDGSHPDEITQIDALVAWQEQRVPLPGTLVLFAAGAGLAWLARRREQ